MVSFFVSINQKGFISDVNWSDPAYLITSKNSSFYDVFESNEKESIEALLKTSLSQDTVIKSRQSYSIINHSSKVFLLFLNTEKQVLVFAIEETASLDGGCKTAFESIFTKFMYMLRTYFKTNAIHNNDSVNFHFDQLQVLNNELINTRRLLEKSNSTLNRLNQQLNNRLVKDSLTGLVSRYQYMNEIEFIINEDPDKLGVFIFIDIDGFKQVNDTYGHAAGDQFLIAFAERLKKLPMENTIRIRIAGDEFGLFVYGLDYVTSKDLHNIWNQIRDFVLLEPIDINGNSLILSISAGMAVYGIDSKGIFEIIELADYAMYQAKKKGKNTFHIFNKSEYDNRLEK
ncbi:MAG: GGDEF domain-containing protein [Clostridia bacterium]|nr:GGDEF domain-containing protein [Clostridia bacterium]